MLNRFAGAFLVLLSLISAYFYFHEKYEALQNSCKVTPARQLINLVESDFESSQVKKNLPPEWDQLASVNYNLSSALAAALLGKERPSFKLSQKGTHNLEIDIIDLPDEADPGIILQISLFEVKTKNKIFEIGRTYNMSQLNNSNP